MRLQGADLLADITVHTIRVALQHSDLSGMYHMVASSETSCDGDARLVIDFARQDGIEIKIASEAIHPVPTSAFPLPAPRSKSSRIGTQKLHNLFVSDSVSLAKRRRSHVE